MLEVLISLFLLSIMSLGGLSMQDYALSRSIQTNHRVVALNFMQTLAEYYAVYAAASTTLSLTSFVFDDTTTPFAGACTRASLITSTPLTQDAARTAFLDCFRADVRDQLPNGATVTILNDGLLTIRVGWGNRRRNQTVVTVAS